MLIKFSLRNFKTFREKAELNLLASNYDQDTHEVNVINMPRFDLRVLKSAVVFGANASGKTKLIDALGFMGRFVRNSSKESQSDDAISVEPFRLNSLSESEPSEFEVIFSYENTLYRYGFEVTKKYIVSEWLYQRNSTKEVELFYRDGQNFEIHKRNFNKGGKIAKDGLVRENALLLSVAAQFNDESATKVLKWFRKLQIISGLQEERYQGFTMSQIEKPEIKKEIMRLLKGADMGIHDVYPQMLDVSALPDSIPKELREFILEKSKDKDASFYSDVITTHLKYNEVIGNTSFSMDNDESSGTKKFFSLTGPILDVLHNGSVLVVDELDSKIHPNLVCEIVNLFHNKDLNINNAQLIFNTHDTNLLSSGCFRRDQIWFVDKNKYGEASLYSLTDFRVRSNSNFEYNYIHGRYGAIPYLGDFSLLYKHQIPESNEK